MANKTAQEANGKVDNVPFSSAKVTKARNKGQDLALQSTVPESKIVARPSVPCAQKVESSGSSSAVHATLKAESSASSSVVHVSQKTASCASSSAVHAAQEAGSSPGVLPVHVPENVEPAGDATAGHEDVAVHQVMDADDDGVVAPKYLFLDKSLPLSQRVSDFERWDADRKKALSEWSIIPKANRPICELCGRGHIGPCRTPEEFKADGNALKEGKMLAAAVRQAKHLEAQAPTKVKVELCRNCAKWHAAGTEACTAPFCARGCGVCHMPREVCREALQRFIDLKLIPARSGDAVQTMQWMPTGSSRPLAVFTGHDPEAVARAAAAYAWGEKMPAEELAEKSGSAKTSRSSKRSWWQKKPPPNGSGRGGCGGRGGSAV